MPDILITPGTFNPPVTPVQNLGISYFPKTPVQTLRKWQQSGARWVGDEAPAVLPPVPVIYSYSDFITGDITVGVDVPSLETGLPEFTTSGVRYVPDGTYTKTGFSSFDKTYNALRDPPFAGSGSIDLGLVEVNTAMDFNFIKMIMGWNIDLAGTDGGLGYSFYCRAGFDGSDEPIGTSFLGVQWPGPTTGTDAEERLIDTTARFAVTLFYDGVMFDQIFLVFRVTGTVRFLDSASSVIPEVASGVTFEDTLFGQSAGSVSVSIPSIPFSGYARESRASQGELTLSL